MTIAIGDKKVTAMYIGDNLVWSQYLKEGTVLFEGQIVPTKSGASTPWIWLGKNFSNIENGIKIIYHYSGYTNGSLQNTDYSLSVPIADIKANKLLNRLFDINILDATAQFNLENTALIWNHSIYSDGKGPSLNLTIKAY